MAKAEVFEIDLHDALRQMMQRQSAKKALPIWDAVRGDLESALRQWEEGASVTFKKGDVVCFRPGFGALQLPTWERPAIVMEVLEDSKRYFDAESTGLGIFGDRPNVIIGVVFEQRFLRYGVDSRTLMHHPGWTDEERFGMPGIE